MIDQEDDMATMRNEINQKLDRLTEALEEFTTKVNELNPQEAGGNSVKPEPVNVQDKSVLSTDRFNAFLLSVLVLIAVYALSQINSALFDDNGDSFIETMQIQLGETNRVLGNFGDNLYAVNYRISEDLGVPDPVAQLVHQGVAPVAAWMSFLRKTPEDVARSVNRNIPNPDSHISPEQVNVYASQHELPNEWIAPFAAALGVLITELDANAILAQKD